MKDNKLNIVINKPAAIIYNFTLDPKNTPSWVDDSAKEETSEWPVKVGTIYKNTGHNGVVLTFIMREMVPNDYFELSSDDGHYHCRYTFKDLGNNTTEYEYHEWQDDHDLDFIMSIEVLEKLKSVLEN